MEEVSYVFKDRLDDDLRYTSKEHKRIVNKVSLILVVWLLFISLGLFISNNYPAIQPIGLLIGFLSIIPVLLLEVRAAQHLNKVKKERTRLQKYKQNYVEPREDIIEDEKIEFNLERQ